MNFRLLGGMVFSAVLLRLTISPFDLSVLAFVGWIPFILSVRYVSLGSAALLGWAHGVFLNALALYWLPGVLTKTANVSPMGAIGGWALLIGWQGGCSLLAAGLLSLAIQRGVWVVVGFPLALTSAELINPAFFPWTSGVFLSATPCWTQLAECLGPLGLTALVGWSNAAIAQSLPPRTSWQRAAWGSARVGLVLGSVGVWGWARIHQVNDVALNSPSIRFGVVQGNLKPAHEETADPAPVYRDASLRLMEAQPPPDILVWPETAIFQPVRKSELYWFLREHAFKNPQSKARITVPVLLGVNLLDAAQSKGGSLAERGETRTNTALLVDPTAKVLGRYDKRRLFPLTETPILPGWVTLAFGLKPGPELAQMTPYLSAGRPEQTPLEIREHRALVTICYEEVFHQDVWDLVRETSPELLITLSSDSWFGDTEASKLHLALARLRAVEHRRYFLRATTTGESVLIAPSGETVWSLPSHQAGAGTLSVHWMHMRSWYSKVGDMPWQISSIAFVALLICPEAWRNWLRRQFKVGRLGQVS